MPQQRLDGWAGPHAATTLWAVLGSLLVALAGLLLGLIGGALGDTSASTAVIGRGLLGLAGVVLSCRIVYERAARLSLRSTALACCAVALAGYALDPLTWNGRALLTQLAADPGLTTVVGDGALWLAAAALGILWGARGLERAGDRAPDRGRTAGGTAARVVDIDGARGWGARGDRGAASIEWTGTVGIAGTLVVAIFLAFASKAPVVGEYARWAICEILTVGQGPCDAPGTAADTHVPTTPCVVSSSASTISRDLEVVLVRVDGKNSYELAHLSDGRYRVTELVGEAAGVTVGAGGGVTFTINDNSYGVGAMADASAQLSIDQGRVWYVSDQAEAKRLISNLRGNAIQDTVTGGSGPADWAWSLGRAGVDLVTGHDSGFPPADETYVQGGVTVNASAEVTSVVLSASGSLGSSTVLGTRTTADGRSTVYLSTTVDAAAAAQYLRNDGSTFGSLDGGRGSGTVQLVTAISYDTTGTMTDVSTTAAARGETAGFVTGLFGGADGNSLANQQSGGIVYRASLPIRTPQDNQLAWQYLSQIGGDQILFAAGQTPLAAGRLATGAPAVLDYVAAARQRGVVTQQTFNDNTGGVGVAADGAAGGEVGGGVSYQTIDRTSASASYWDGTAWVPWTACG